jgi:hypothetical protein
LFAGGADVLAGESTANNVSCSWFWLIGTDVIVNGDVGPVLAEHLLTEGFHFYELNGGEAAHQAFSGVAETTDAREQVNQPQGLGCGHRRRAGMLERSAFAYD